MSTTASQDHDTRRRGLLFLIMSLLAGAFMSWCRGRDRVVERAVRQCGCRAGTADPDRSRRKIGY